jgi:predicted aconitase with swiveling domain
MIIRGRKIYGGKVEGEAMVQKENFSFLGDVDEETGIINAGTNANKSFADKVFIFPMGKGSTFGPYVAFSCAKNGVSPKAMLCQNADGVVVLAAIMAKIPAIHQFEKNIMDFVQTGDHLKIDADRGTVEIVGRL